MEILTSPKKSGTKRGEKLHYGETALQGNCIAFLKFCHLRKGSFLEANTEIYKGTKISMGTN